MPEKDFDNIGDCKQAPGVELDTDDSGATDPVIHRETHQENIADECCPEDGATDVGGVTTAFCGFDFRDGKLVGAPTDPSFLTGIVDSETETSSVKVERDGCTVKLVAKTKGLTVNRCGVRVTDGIVQSFPPFILGMEFDEEIGLTSSYDPARCIWTIEPNENFRGCIGTDGGGNDGSSVPTGDVLNVWTMSCPCVGGGNSDPCEAAVQLIELGTGLYRLRIVGLGECAGNTFNVPGLDTQAFAADNNTDANSQADALIAAADLGGCTVVTGYCPPAEAGPL